MSLQVHKNRHRKLDDCRNTRWKLISNNFTCNYWSTHTRRKQKSKKWNKSVKWSMYAFYQVDLIKETSLVHLLHRTFSCPPTEILHLPLLSFYMPETERISHLFMTDAILINSRVSLKKTGFQRCKWKTGQTKWFLQKWEYFWDKKKQFSCQYGR